MTEEQYDKLGGYVQTIRDALAMTNWTVRLEHRPAEDGNTAEIQCVYGRKLANLRVCDDWWERTPDDQRHTIVHELLHCHLDGADTVIRGLREVLGGPAHSVACEAHHTALEFAADGIADAVSPLLPLPPWAHDEEGTTP